MLEVIIILLLVLWIFGYIDVSGITFPRITLFNINGEPITLFNLIIFLLVIWAIGILPGPIRAIASVLLLLWVLSILNILSLGGFSNILLISIIGGLILYLFTYRKPV